MTDVQNLYRRVGELEDTITRLRKNLQYQQYNLDEDNVPRLLIYSRLISQNSAAVTEVKQEVSDTQATISLLSQYTNMDGVVVVESSDDKSAWDKTRVYYDSTAKVYYYHDGTQWKSTTSPVTAGLDASIAKIQATADDAAASVETIVSSIGSNGSVTAASIVAKINAAGSAVQISADHISLKGKTIALTTDEIDITSTYFNVAKSGAVSCTSLAVSGNNSSINIAGGSINSALIRTSYYNDTNTYSYMSPQGLCVNNSNYNGSVQMFQGGIMDLGFINGYQMYCSITRDSFVLQSGATNSATLYAYSASNVWGSSNTVTVNGVFAVNGSKAKLEQTEHYGNRLMYAFETPNPMYSDFGRATIAEDGLCYVFLDPVFYECIENSYDYFVFIQSESSGEFAVVERTADRFMVQGTPGTSFAWMLVTAQKGYSATRTEELIVPEPEPAQTPDPENAVYDAVGDEMLKEFENQLG